jgi:hypothetical protein
MKNVASALFFLLLEFISFFCPNQSFGNESVNISLPNDTKIAFALFGEGVQIYKSVPNVAGGFRWMLQAPSAVLKTAAGKDFVGHSAGPAWTAKDGSRIVGKLPPVQSMPTPDPGNIPWLLITTESKGSQGVLSPIRYVLRIATVGGMPSKKPPVSQDETVSTHYRATYLFLTKNK